MKKRTKIIFSVLVVAAVLAATYRVVNRPPSASLESSAQMEEIIASSGCMACHTAKSGFAVLCQSAGCRKAGQGRCSSGLPLFRHDSDVRSLEKRRESQ